MADYSVLKQAIRDTIYDNTDQDITGAKLQGTLLEMVDELGQSYVKPQGGIPSTDMAQAVQDSLSAADAAYKKPQGGIPSTDLAAAVRASLALADTAVQPADLPAPEFFFATYGTTTFAQVTAARSAGKVCVVPYDGGFFILGRSVGESTGDPVTEYFFTSIEANASKRVSLKNTDAWSYSAFYLEMTYCKVQTITGHESSTTDYPSTKAVADALATKQGTLTFDDAPTTGSNNPVKSGGIKTAIDAKYTKPANGIPASDMEAGVIPTVPTDIVKYTAQTLTDAQKAQARTNIGAGTYSKPVNGIPKTDLAQAVRTSLNRADAAIIYTNLGEPDWEEYDYDTSAFLTTLRETGYYSFTMDEEYVYYVAVQAVAMGTYTYVLQQYWSSEEGPGNVYYRGFVYDDDNDEVVSDNEVSYISMQQASEMFAAKTHYHYKNVRDTASIWSYCNSMSSLDATSKVVYTDSTTSTQWLIEGAYTTYQPAVRYQKVTQLQGGTCFYQRCGTVSGSTVTWGPWYRFDATMPIATTQPSGGFLPNLVYDLGVLTGTVTFALASPTDNTRPNPYHWTFDTGATAPAITWPSGLTWLDGSEPQMEASKHYEIMVRNGYATVLVFSL